MNIEENIHGLPNDIKEVDVDTMPHTSCYMPLERDETYVIYGSRDPETPGLIRYHACSFSFQVNGHEVLLDALRESARGGGSRLLGFIRQKGDLFTALPAVSGISVLARNGPTTLQTSTKAGGQYEFRTIPPGDWKVDIDSPLFKVDRTYERRDSVTVAAGACEVKNIDIVTDGHIKGTVRDAKGNGIPNIPVEAFAIDSRNEPESTALRKATTDAAVYSVYNKSGKDGRLELSLWRGETYVIESFLYSSQLLPSRPEAPRLELKEWRGKTGAIYLGESENYAKVTLRLMP